MMGMGHGAWGMGHGAWGMGHGAWGMGGQGDGGTRRQGENNLKLLILNSYPIKVKIFNPKSKIQNLKSYNS